MYCTRSNIYPVAGEKRDGVFCLGYWTLSGERFLSSIVSEGENIYWERLEIISRFLVEIWLCLGRIWTMASSSVSISCLLLSSQPTINCPLTCLVTGA